GPVGHVCDAAGIGNVAGGANRERETAAQDRDRAELPASKHGIGQCRGPGAGLSRSKSASLAVRNFVDSGNGETVADVEIGKLLPGTQEPHVERAQIVDGPGPGVRTKKREAAGKALL